MFLTEITINSIHFNNVSESEFIHNCLRQDIKKTILLPWPMKPREACLVRSTKPIKSVQNSSSMWLLSFNVCIKINSMRRACSTHDALCRICCTQVQRHHIHKRQHHLKDQEPNISTHQMHWHYIAGRVGPTEEQSGFSLRCRGLPPVYQTPGRRPNSAPSEGIRFLLELCCDHTEATYNSQPSNFNAAVMSLLSSSCSTSKWSWNVVHPSVLLIFFD